MRYCSICSLSVLRHYPLIIVLNSLWLLFSHLEWISLSVIPVFERNSGFPDSYKAEISSHQSKVRKQLDDS